MGFGTFSTRIALVSIAMFFIGCSPKKSSSPSDSSGTSPSTLSVVGSQEFTNPTAFTITGVHVTPVNGAAEAQIEWTDSTGELTYFASIFESDGVTVKCAEVTLNADILSQSFTGCMLSEGLTYLARVKAVASGGGFTLASNADYMFVPDITVPSLTITSGPSGLTLTDQGNFTFVANDTLSGVALTRCQVDAGPFADCASPFSLAGLSEGVHTVVIRALDVAGNSVDVSRNFTVDTQIPTLNLGAGPGTFTQLTNVNIAYTAADTGSGVDHVECSFDGVAYSACSTPVTLTGLSQGAHTLNAKAYDIAGRESVVSQATWFVDHTAPSAAIVTQPNSLISSSSASISWTTSDPGGAAASGVLESRCSVDGASYSVCSSPLNLSSLTEGPHTALIKIVDQALNESSVLTVNFSVDLTGPSGFTIAGITGGTDVIADNSLAVGLIATVGWSDSVGEDSYEVTLYESNGSTVKCATQGASANAVSLTFSGCTLTDGASYKAVVVAKDSAGNVQAASNSPFDFTVTLDVPAQLTLSDGSPYSYGTLNMGAITYKTFTVTNLGEASASSMSATALGSPFGYRGGFYPGTGGTCASQLATMASCTIVTQFYPQTGGSFNGTLTLNYYDGATNQSVSKSLTGTGNALTPTQLGAVMPSGVAVNQCAAVTVQSQATGGVAANVSSNTTVTLAINNATNTSFYTTNACSTTTSSVVITAGSSSAVAYIRSTTSPQNATLVFTASGLTAASLPFNITGAPSQLNLFRPAQVVANKCQKFTVRRMDSNGNLTSNATSVTVDLSQDASGAFYSDAACLGSTLTQISISAWSTSQDFWFKDQAVESIAVTAQDASSTLTQASDTFNVLASATWWNTSWNHRVALTINNLDQATTFTNMPVLVKLSTLNVDYADFGAAGIDIRFVDDTDTTVLSYEIEKWNSSGESFIWVNVPTLLLSKQTTVYMYYGNGAATNGQSVSSVWSQYWGVWHLGESPGATAPQFKDSTASANHGSAETSPASATGAVGEGLDLNGNFDAVLMSVDLSSVLGKTSTFSAYMKSTQVGNNTTWLAPGITGVEQSGGGNDIFFGYIDASGYIGVSSGNGASAKSGFRVNDNAWRHVSITRNETTGLVQFFINGVLNGSGTSETGAKTTPFYRFGVIGDTGGTPTDYDGFLDEVRIYNTVQSSERIKADYKYMAGTHVSFSDPEDKP